MQLDGATSWRLAIPQARWGDESTNPARTDAAAADDSRPAAASAIARGLGAQLSPELTAVLLEVQSRAEARQQAWWTDRANGAAYRRAR